VVGDIHGNIDLLLRIIERFGYPPKFQYLFLGDYVDRGTHSCEVLFLLFALKVRYPDHVHLLRGNHEFPEMAGPYGFKAECQTRISGRLYEGIMDVFGHLPIAAVVGANFCVHGGLSPRLTRWSQISTIQKLKRNASNETSEDMALVWSDPRADIGYFEASPRGCGFLYGQEAVGQFTLEGGATRRIIRAHESCAKGFEWPIPDNDRILTLFSSCDYCQMGNDAAVAVVNDADLDLEFQQFEPVVGSGKQRRRVQYPEWTLEPEMKAVEVDLMDDISAYIEV
jgi:protein phosphatase